MPNNSTVKAQRQSLRNIHYAMPDRRRGTVFSM